MLRLCLCVEVTTRHARYWPHVLEALLAPLLGYLDAASSLQSCEIACVLFGSHPPFSTAAVQSTLGWCSGTAQLRQLVECLEFVGGGGQPVALAEALLEAAGLFCLPSSSISASGCQQHCLVCLATEPASCPVPWPYTEDCTLVSAATAVA